jgi:ferritin-like metal-binding protein YciE
MMNAHKKNADGIAHAEYLEFFIDGLKDIYWVEKTLIKEMPKMIKKASSIALVRALEDHLKETNTHASNLEKVFELLSKKPAAKKCEAMHGIMEEAKELLEEAKSSKFLTDVAIVCGCQKVEHYEIATYGCLAMMAKKLGYSAIEKLLQENVKQEKAAEQTLMKTLQEIHERTHLQAPEKAQSKETMKTGEREKMAVRK